MKSEQLDRLKEDMAAIVTAFQSFPSGKLNKTERGILNRTGLTAQRLLESLTAVEADEPTPAEMRERSFAEMIARNECVNATTAGANLLYRLKRLMEDAEQAITRFQQEEPKDAGALHQLAERLQHDFMWGVVNMQTEFSALHDAAFKLAVTKYKGV